MSRHPRESFPKLTDVVFILGIDVELHNPNDRVVVVRSRSHVASSCSIRGIAACPGHLIGTIAVCRQPSMVLPP